MVRANNPLVVGLVETKAGRYRADRVKMEVGFQNSFVVESRGKAGDDSFRLTLFYGHPVTHRRAESWELIRTLNRMMDKPWLIFGDFNEVLFGWEVKGRRIRGEWQMKKFREVMQDCNLSDIGFRGAQFTYSNKRKGVWEVKARLDRAIANGEWRQWFPTAEVWHEVSGCSDHSPLIIRWKTHRKVSRLKLFRFEPMWLRHSEYGDVVRGMWEGSAGNTHNLTDCLQACGEGLKTWNNQRFGNVRGKIKELQEKLGRIQKMERTNDVTEQEVKITRDLDEWFLREELLWKQRSTVDWLREEDRNTRFFHQRASYRRKVNRIEKLQSNEGEWITEEEEICGLIVKYFGEILKASRDDTSLRWSEWMRFVPSKLNDEMRTELTRQYSESEIIRMMNNGMLEEGINKTLITLIPKVKDPKSVGEYRPISLCNVGVKIITKVLANRLKRILPAIISENQGPFVPEKIISDNIIAAQEVIHYIRTRSRQKVKEYQRDRKLRGVKICRDAPEVTHMLFADDSVFFLRANRENALSLKKILEDYEALSGQKVNLSKSEIYFGRNVVEDDRRMIGAILGVRQVETMSKYLGLPVAFGHNRTEMFRDIIGRIWKKLQGWKEKALSIAGKEVLIKAVIQAMPTYAMSCFKIPDTLIKRIVSMITNYWWSNNKEGRGIHWCKYRNLCKDKMEGGVGFKELSIFNDALLAKQVWRLMEKPDNLVSKLLKEKYYKEANPINCQLGNRPSLMWRSIWTAG
ncbi:hypothetical protein QQ045_016693 [Rhodiola kirilowii]